MKKRMRWLRDYQHRWGAAPKPSSNPGTAAVQQEQIHTFRKDEENDVYVHNAREGLRLDIPGLRYLKHIEAKEGEDFEFIEPHD